MKEKNQSAFDRLNLQFFSRKEFICPCCQKEDMKENCLILLDAARHISGVPIIINSGWRCEKHNKKVKGTPNSAHLSGLAADIRCDNSRTRFLIVMALITVGFNRIKVTETFIHADLDTTKTPEVLWLS